MSGNTGENLLIMLERRVDNVITRAGLAASRPEARQLIGHGHITVAGRKVDISSYLVKPGEIIGVRDKENTRERAKDRLSRSRGHSVPSWLAVDPKTYQIKVLAMPTREEVALPVQEQLIVELCSR